MALIALSDNYDDNSRDAAKWALGNWEGLSTTGVTVSETGGQLVVTPAASAADSRYSGYVSVGKYDFSSNEAFVRLVERTNTAGGAETQFVAYVDANNAAIFLIEGNNLSMQKREGGVTAPVATATFAAGSHAWLRIRGTGTSIAFDVAPSTAADPPASGEWQQLGIFVPTFAKTSLGLYLGAGTWQSVATPGSARFDGFNTATTGAAQASGVIGEFLSSKGRR